ncbi:uncharacterized protein BDV17DRAFT_259266 [Aspergillus undulatus]|uniref:uncharacterized protein n=1 Tax=Aspergillus undulatus TaxID=1810928 RepID=UPI003CCDEE42
MAVNLIQNPSFESGTLSPWDPPRRKRRSSGRLQRRIHSVLWRLLPRPPISQLIKPHPRHKLHRVRTNPHARRRQRKLLLDVSVCRGECDVRRDCE